MAQEQFAGPEHYTEFDPEKFIRDLKIQAGETAGTEADLEADAEDANGTQTSTEDLGQ